MGVLSRAIEKTLRPAVTSLIDELLLHSGVPDYQVRLWDGMTLGNTKRPRFTLVLNSPDALGKLLASSDELSLGEAYVAGEFDVEGDLEAAFELEDYLLSRDGTVHAPQSAGLALLNTLANSNPPEASSCRPPELEGPPHSKPREKQAIRYHYDLPPAFFALWLDPSMLYSAAYFSSSLDLAQAQTEKMHYICQKLRLQPGDRLLDIGCGWGGLLVYAARNFGVEARGITLSIRQAETARARIREAGVKKRCRVEICDYRDLEDSHQFDKIVSVGMFEHVGEALLPEYFRRAWDLLQPGGVFLNSGIASTPSRLHNGPSLSIAMFFPTEN
jgi:cyclopropane-fatty-acyl-phospholipid synthase